MVLALVLAAIPALAAAFALAVAFYWPRNRVTHRYEVFIAAPRQTVWDTYFAHIKKADYRPGTRLLDAEILGEAPLTVRLTVQQDIAPQPRQVVLTYDLYQPPARYRLQEAGGGLVEEGEFLAEADGTRLVVNITGAMRGFVAPFLVRRRVARNHLALKAYCEGKAVAPPRPPLPPAAWWESWVVLALFASLFLPVPWWPLHLALGIAGLGVLVLWGRRFGQLVRRL